MNEAAETPAAAENVATGDDTSKARRHLSVVPDAASHPLRRLRDAQGLTQREVAERAGCNSRTVAAVEGGKRVPSVELARQLAAAVGCSLGDVFGDPRPCECGCRELTYSRFVKGHFRPGAVVSRQRSAELETYKRERGLLGAPELAAATGMRRRSLTRLVRQRRLPAERYPGTWPDASRPWLFTRNAVELVKRIQTVERHESYRRRARAFHAARRSRGLFGTKPRRGERRECPDGCGRVTYLHPSELSKRPGYATISCACRQRWQTGRISEDMLKGGQARRRWRGRWKLLEVRPQASNKKGEAAARMVGARAIELLDAVGEVAQTTRGRRAVLEQLMQEFEGQRALVTPDGRRRPRRHPDYRMYRARIVRRVKRAGELLGDSRLKTLI